MGSEIILAHLTDPHIDLGAPRGRELLGKRGLSFLSWVRTRRRIQREDLFAAIVADIASAAPDLVALTGDLVNFALEVEFRRGREWLERLGPPERVAVVPGNHEALAPHMIRTLHGCWGSYLAGDDGQPRFPWRRDVGPISLVGISTAAATLPFLATGLVGRDQLDGLDAMLSRLAAEERMVVVLIHHPPTDIIHRRKALTDAGAVREVLARHGVGLVLHGHTHRSELSWIDGRSGRIPVLGAPSASWIPGPGREGAAWRLFRLAEADGVWRGTLVERAVGRDGMIAARSALVFSLPSASSAADTLEAADMPGRMPTRPVAGVSRHAGTPW